MKASGELSDKVAGRLTKQEIYAIISRHLSKEEHPQPVEVTAMIRLTITGTQPLDELMEQLSGRANHLVFDHAENTITVDDPFIEPDTLEELARRYGGTVNR